MVAKKWYKWDKNRQQRIAMIRNRQKYNKLPKSGTENGTDKTMASNRRT